MIKLVGMTFNEFVKSHNLEHWNEVETCRYCGVLLDKIEFGESKDFIMAEWKPSTKHLEHCLEGSCFVRALPKNQEFLREAFEEIEE